MQLADLVRVVESSESSCTVKKLTTGIELYGVRFTSIESGKIKMKPKVDSIGIIAYLDEEEAVFISYSELEELNYELEACKFVMNEDGIKIENKGKNLKEELFKYFDEVEKIIVAQGTTINIGKCQQIRKEIDKILQ